MQQCYINLSLLIHPRFNILCLSQKRLLLSVTAYAMFSLLEEGGMLCHRAGVKNMV